MTILDKGFLKATSILYVVFSTWTILYIFWGDLTFGSIPFIGYRIFMGIMGIKYCNIPEKARKLRRYAIADLVFYGADLLMGIILVAPFYALDILPVLAFPVLYLIGASKNIAVHNDGTWTRAWTRGDVLPEDVRPEDMTD